MEDTSSLAAGTAFFLLPDQTEFLFTGPDRFRYLNGQLTVAVSERMPAETEVSACVLTAKGKMCALVRLRREQQAIRINAEPELRDGLATRLEKYIIADEVEFHDVTGATMRLHVAKRLPSEWGHGFSVTAANRIGVAGTDILCKPADLPMLLDALTAAGFSEIDRTGVEPFRIEHGIPYWGAELTPDILPMEAGLADTAIDFHKGCYLGQEIISRIRSVGHVNKRLMRLSSATEIRPGSKLFMTGSDPDERAAGWITSTAYSFTLETWVALGYVKSAVTDNRLEARDPEGTVTAVEVRGPAGERE